MKQKPFPIALIGQAFMGRAHSNAWRQVTRFFDVPLAPVLHTIAGRDMDALPWFAERFGWERWTARWQDIAEEPAIQLVDIGTPNHLHREMAVAMLAAGKHVACEKPLAGTLEDATVMRDAAKKSKAKTFVWFNYRRAPAIGLAWKLLREGRLGKVLHVRASYLQDWGGPDTPLSWRFQKKFAGSGAHGDLNAHLVDLARFLVGEELTTVHGALERTFVKQRAVPGSTKKGKSDVDDCMLFLASFKGGATASFEASRLAGGHLNDNTIEVNGELGSLRWNLESMNELWFYDSAERPRLDGWRRIVATRGGEHPYADAWWPDGHILGYEHTFTNMLADVLRVLGGQTPEYPLPDFEDAYRTQRVLEAALVAARERRTVEVGEIS